MKQSICYKVAGGSVFWLCYLTACAPDPKPPEPTVNPHPSKTTELKISVQPGFGIDNVEVSSTWQIGNIGCAPLRPISGAPAQKFVNTNEKVEKLDQNNYLVTIINDRFLPDKCRWGNFVFGIHFMRNGKVLSYGGAVNPVHSRDSGDFADSKILKLSCQTYEPVRGAPPICWYMDKEPFLKAHNMRPFEVTIEVEKADK